MQLATFIELFFAIGAWVGAVVCGMWIGNLKGRQRLAIRLTVFLGWIGVLILLCVPAAKAPR
jgi:hypothetical protein